MLGDFLESAASVGLGVFPFVVLICGILPK